MSAIGNGKGMGFYSDRGPQSGWVRALGCSCGNSYPQFPNASILGMRNLLCMCGFSYYLNNDFLRFRLLSCPSSNLLSPISDSPSPAFHLSWFPAGKMYILLFLPIPWLLSSVGSFPVQQPWPYLQFLPFPPLQLTLSVTSVHFPLHPPKASHASCWICCHFFPCSSYSYVQLPLLWPPLCMPPYRKLQCFLCYTIHVVHHHVCRNTFILSVWWSVKYDHAL